MPKQLTPSRANLEAILGDEIHCILFADEIHCFMPKQLTPSRANLAAILGDEIHCIMPEQLLVQISQQSWFVFI
jgi:hypothetical protein